jgi:hypothetical protein
MKKLIQILLLIPFLVATSAVIVKPAKAETVTDFQAGESFSIPLQVASRGYYTINVSSHFGGDADVYLYDANNVLIGKASEGGSDTLEGYLTAGNYRIRIHMFMCMFDDCTAHIIVRRDGRKVELFR